MMGRKQPNNALANTANKLTAGVDILFLTNEIDRMFFSVTHLRAAKDYPNTSAPRISLTRKYTLTVEDVEK